jgi:hypothetical protein
MTQITKWVTISFVTIIVAYSLLFQILNAQTGEFSVYHISVLYKGRDHVYETYNLPSAPNSTVNIYEKVLDKYGTVDKATLSYCVNNCYNPNHSHIGSLNNTTLRLIDGTPSHGTYMGVIPPQKDNTVVFYDIHFGDNLGYTDNDTIFGKYEVKGHYIG